MNVVEPTAEVNKAVLPPPPLRLETGSIVTLRMRGHTRTQGLEYYAPAVVLNQHMPGGEIEVLIWDSTAGTHYNASYPVRELSTRGDGAEREMYVVQENVGKVLFSPDTFAEMALVLMHVENNVRTLISDLDARLSALELGLGGGANASATPLPSTEDAKRPPKKV